MESFEPVSATKVSCKSVRKSLFRENVVFEACIPLPRQLLNFYVINRQNTKFKVSFSSRKFFQVTRCAID